MHLALLGRTERARPIASLDYDSNSSELDNRSTPHSMRSYCPSWDNDYSDSESAVGYPTLNQPQPLRKITTVVKKLRDVVRYVDAASLSSFLSLLLVSLLYKRQQSDFAGREIRTGSFTAYTVGSTTFYDHLSETSRDLPHSIGDLRRVIPSIAFNYYCLSLFLCFLCL